MKLEVLAKTTQNGDYYLILSVTDAEDNVMTSSQIAMPQKAKYDNLQMASLAGSASNINVEDSSSNINVEDISIEKPMSLRLRHSGTPEDDFKSLATNPDELKDILLVLHYKLSEVINEG